MSKPADITLPLGNKKSGNKAGDEFKRRLKKVDLKLKKEKLAKLSLFFGMLGLALMIAEAELYLHGIYDKANKFEKTFPNQAFSTLNLFIL